MIITLLLLLACYSRHYMYIFIADFVYSLLNKAQREFHDMFLRTYGVMYENNAAVFQTYFRDLKTFYEKGLYSPLDSTDSFFNTLYQKMFQVNEIFRRHLSHECF